MPKAVTCRASARLPISEMGERVKPLLAILTADRVNSRNKLLLTYTVAGPMGRAARERGLSDALRLERRPRVLYSGRYLGLICGVSEPCEFAPRQLDLM